MKKRFLLPCLLLVASLTACGGGSGGGLVSGGTAYTDGDAAKVNAQVKADTEGKIATVKQTIKETATTSTKTNGVTVKSSTKLEGYINVDIATRQLDGDVNATVSGSVSGQKYSQKMGGKFKASVSENGFVSISEGATVLSELDMDLEGYYTSASYEIFSWNFTSELGSIESAMDTNGSPEAAKQFAAEFVKSLAIKGDASTGTFDVGLSKQVGFTYQGANMKFTKLLYSFKDCLLQSAVVGFSYSGADSYEGTSVSVSLTSETVSNFSYTFVK